MKRIIYSLLLMTTVLTAMAQETTTDTLRHLEFMNEPICGSLNSFVNKMAKKGFTFSEITPKGIAIMKGTYENIEDCDLYIYSDTRGKNVNSVAVSLPYKDTWQDLSDDYFKMKEKLTKRYGPPEISIEVFETPVPYDLRMLYVRTGRCDYKSTFKRDNGVIAVAINSVTFKHQDYCNVRLIYMDDPNHGSTEEKDEATK